MATLDRVKIKVEEFVSTTPDPMKFYCALAKNWKAINFPASSKINMDDGIIRVIGYGNDVGKNVEIIMDIEPADKGLRVWASIEYPSSKFWWTVCLIGIPFGFGLALLAMFFVSDQLSKKPERVKRQFEKVVKRTAESM